MYAVFPLINVCTTVHYEKRYGFKKKNPKLYKQTV